MKRLLFLLPLFIACEHEPCYRCETDVYVKKIYQYSYKTIECEYGSFTTQVGDTTYRKLCH